MTAASNARKQNPEAEISVFTEDEHFAYSPCAIPYVIEGKIRDFESIIMHDLAFYKKERNIDIHTRTKVAGADLAKKSITLADGATHHYDSLVVATGSNVLIPPVQGADLKGVFTVRNINDGMIVRDALKVASCVVIAGASVVGLEVAIAARRLGKKVTVIDLASDVIPRLLDGDMAALVRRYCESIGMEFVMSSPIQALTGTGTVTGIRARDQEFPCQVVILATGVRANLELPMQMGLEIGALGGVRVSDTLQPYVKGRLVKDVYVAGDVIQCQSAVATGPTMSQLGSSATRQGRVAGINAAGGYATYPRTPGAWVSCMGDIQVGGTGLSRALAEYYGIKVVEEQAEGLTRARYFPGGLPITVKLVADAATHRLVGSQIVGGEGVTGRINWLTAAIMKDVTVEEFVRSFENAYCPATTTVEDVVNTAADRLAQKVTCKDKTLGR